MPFIKSELVSEKYIKRVVRCGESCISKAKPFASLLGNKPVTRKPKKAKDDDRRSSGSEEQGTTQAYNDSTTVTDGGSSKWEQSAGGHTTEKG